MKPMHQACQTAFKKAVQEENGGLRGGSRVDCARNQQPDDTHQAMRRGDVVRLALSWRNARTASVRHAHTAAGDRVRQRNWSRKFMPSRTMLTSMQA